MKRILTIVTSAVLLAAAPSLAFNQDDYQSVLGATYMNGNPMNDNGIVCEDCDLSRADFEGVNLTEAEFAGSDLSEAKLTGANLSNADLSATRLIGAILDLADLSGTDLTDANLTAASMTAVRMAGVVFCRTIMPDRSVRSDHCEA